MTDKELAIYETSGQVELSKTLGAVKAAGGLANSNDEAMFRIGFLAAWSRAWRYIGYGDPEGRGDYDPATIHLKGGA